MSKTFRWAQKHKGQLPLKSYKLKIATFHTPFIDLAVIFLPKSGVPEILLELRPDNIYPYPNQWNIPGGNFLHRETLKQASKRLLKNSGCSGQPIFTGVATYVKTQAEVGISFLFVKKLTAKKPRPKKGWKFFRLDKPPKNLVPWQKNIYPKMIRRFLSGKPPIVLEYLGED